MDGIEEDFRGSKPVINNVLNCVVGTEGMTVLYNHSLRQPLFSLSLSFMQGSILYLLRTLLSFIFLCIARELVQYTHSLPHSVLLVLAALSASFTLLPPALLPGLTIGSGPVMTDVVFMNSPDHT